jgi:hypothetical protein
VRMCGRPLQTRRLSKAQCRNRRLVTSSRPNLARRPLPTSSVRKTTKTAPGIDPVNQLHKYVGPIFWHGCAKVDYSLTPCMPLPVDLVLTCACAHRRSRHAAENIANTHHVSAVTPSMGTAPRLPISETPAIGSQLGGLPRRAPHTRWQNRTTSAGPQAIQGGTRVRTPDCNLGPTFAYT